MATTRIIPLHAGKGRTVGKAISDTPTRKSKNWTPAVRLFQKQ